MSDHDRDVERTNRRVRPWTLTLFMIFVVGYGGSTVTRNSGWAVVAGLMMVVGGLVVLVVELRELIRHRKARQ